MAEIPDEFTEGAEGAGGDQPFSPFSAPVADKKTGPGGGSVPDGVKLEEISEAEATGQDEEIQSGGDGGNIPDDGNPPGAAPQPQPQPMDAPIFTPPNFADVPNAEIPADNPLSDDTGGGGGSGGGTTKVPDGFGKEFADYTAQWLVDIFFKIFLQAVRTYCKIDKTEVLRAVNQGHIHPRFVGFIDKLNKKVDAEIDVTDEEKDFVIGPLKQFMVIKKIEVKPEWMMLGSLAMVAVSIGMRAHDLKNQNAEILQNILRESAEIKRGGGGSAAGSVTDIPTEPDSPPGAAGINVEDFTKSAETSSSADEGGFTAAN
jgi:hypothetical protein